jgi:hypothetical protein
LSGGYKDEEEADDTGEVLDQEKGLGRACGAFGSGHQTHIFLKREEVIQQLHLLLCCSALQTDAVHLRMYLHMPLRRPPQQSLR